MCALSNAKVAADNEVLKNLEQHKNDFEDYEKLSQLDKTISLKKPEEKISGSLHIFTGSAPCLFKLEKNQNDKTITCCQYYAYLIHNYPNLKIYLYFLKDRINDFSPKSLKPLSPNDLLSDPSIARVLPQDKIQNEEGVTKFKKNKRYMAVGKC